MTPRPNAIFISYRRKDSLDVTGRIYDYLSRYFGDKAVFKDVNSLHLGSRFGVDLNETIGQCQVLIAVIGEQWVKILYERLEKSQIDWVQEEITMAIKRGIRIIPLLVGEAELPNKKDLPDGLKDLTKWSAGKARPDPDFEVDMHRLIRDLEDVLEPLSGHIGTENSQK